LGVSRNTVVAAYEDLAADDLIRGERGSGMRVNGSSHRVTSSSWLRDVVRTAKYPERVLSIADPDGNSLYLNF
jgi:DNA-binding GntR family transcriptional regulator